MLVKVIFPADVSPSEEPNLPARFYEQRSYNLEVPPSYDNLKACEAAFAYYNADDRPNGQVDRSMSVGDICEVNGKRYICLSIGFKEINDEQYNKAMNVTFRDRMFWKDVDDIGKTIEKMRWE